jgi:outer membrane protein W
MTQRTNIKMTKNKTNYYRQNRIKAKINPWVRMLVLGFTN